MPGRAAGTVSAGSMARTAAAVPPDRAALPGLPDLPVPPDHADRLARPGSGVRRVVAGLLGREDRRVLRACVG